MERWKPIPEYEGIYEASNLGRIRTAIEKTTYTERHGFRHWKQRVLKQKYQKRSNGRTDARVSLWKGGKGKTHLVARLVALAWCDGYEEGMTVNHIDGNPMNNKASNLEWLSIADNIRHGFRTGLFANTMKPVSLVIDNKETYFQSLSAASIALGHKPGYLSNKMGAARKNVSRMEVAHAEQNHQGINQTQSGD